MAAFPNVRWSTVADDLGLLHLLVECTGQLCGAVASAFDIDNGMHRSGIEPGSAAVELYRKIATLLGLEPGGLHVYDGHIRDLGSGRRERQISAERSAAGRCIATSNLLAHGCPVPRVVAGGSGSFPVHARRSDLNAALEPACFGTSTTARSSRNPTSCSPPAAGPGGEQTGGNRLCVDLGYKAVSPDNPLSAGGILNLSAAKVLNHSEEHLALETSEAELRRGRSALWRAVSRLPDRRLLPGSGRRGRRPGRPALADRGPRRAIDLLKSAPSNAFAMMTSSAPSFDRHSAIGRDAGWRTVAGHVDRCLVGATGIGKTQLGLQFAQAGAARRGGGASCST